MTVSFHNIYSQTAFHVDGFKSENEQQQWQQQCVSWSAQVQLWTGLSQLTFTAPPHPLAYLETCLVLDSHLARRAALRLRYHKNPFLTERNTFLSSASISRLRNGLLIPISLSGLVSVSDCVCCCLRSSLDLSADRDATTMDTAAPNDKIRKMFSWSSSITWVQHIHDTHEHLVTCPEPVLSHDWSQRYPDRVSKSINKKSDSILDKDDLKLTRINQGRVFFFIYLN